VGLFLITQYKDVDFMYNVLYTYHINQISKNGAFISRQGFRKRRYASKLRSYSTMTAPTLKTYPRYQDRQRNFPTNTGLVASFTVGGGWKSAGYGLPVPAVLSEVVKVEETAA
jgi:hypothetical protein